ncbi:peptidyl-tRNA hydrolase domain-containing protein 1, partial [Coelomomyces lativittatus]
LLNWSTGSVIAQACHASTLALYRFKDHPNTLLYMSEENQLHLHKVIYEVASLKHLDALSNQLQEHKVDHILWKELPEEIYTAIATRPYRRSELPPNIFKRCSLYR